MSKKITLTIGLCSLMFATSLFSASGEDERANSSINLEKLQDTFYKRGHKDGLRTGYARGYAMALEDAKAKISSYATKIESYENGKYLSADGKVTAPRLYQYIDRRSGNMSVIVEGCKLDKKLSPKDIIELPMYPDVISMKQKSNGVYENATSSIYEKRGYNDKISNSVKVVRRDMNHYKNKTPTFGYSDEISVEVDNNRYYNERLAQANIEYTLSSNDKIKVILKNEREREIFYKEIHK